MGEDTFKSMSGKELRVTRFAMAGKAAQAQTAGGDQGVLAAYGAGANGFDSEANAQKLYKLVVEIRAALVANGTIKGSA